MVRGADIVLADGTAAVVKTAEAPEAAALRAEGERLEAAHHPGVVEVLRSVGDEAHWELCLAHGGRPATLVRVASPEQVATIVAAAAATLADLHERGVVHGRLQARHLLVGAEGAVRICGFGPGPDDAVPADDVAALGAVLVELLGDREAIEPVPEQRWQRQRPWSGVARRSLLAVADLACAEPPSRRPTARRLAAVIAEAVPTGGRASSRATTPRVRRVVTGPGPSPRPLHRARTGTGLRRARAAAVAAVGAALLVAASGRIMSDGARSPEVPVVPSVEASTCAVVEPAVACQPIEIDGTAVRVGRIRFEVGQPGDEVIALDWDCDGSSTPAVLRPSTGEVFLFPRWAADGPVAVEAVAVVPGAQSIRPPTEPCGPPVVSRDDGTTVPIPGGPNA